MHSCCLGILSPKSALLQKLLVKQHILPGGHASSAMLLIG
jgi:hypothetical protein